ncbi:hypothetical protein EV426DRAFT_630063 [Tirmania nivea]|nr:hypothetical protein EV426DRAFT_630063 [Tirmania nivea]
MDQHLREAALLYFSNSKQWNFGRFLNHLDTLSFFPKDKKSRHGLGTELWRSLLLDYAGDDSYPEDRIKALQELAKFRKPMVTVTNNTVNADPNCTTENNHHIVTITPGAKEVEADLAQQCGKKSFLENPDSAVPPPPYKVPVPPQAPPTGFSKLVGPCNEFNKDSKPPISISPRLSTSIKSTPIEITRTPEQVHLIDCIDINNATKPCIEVYSLLSTPPRDGFAEVDLSGFDYGDFPEFVGDDTAELLAAFDFDGTCEVPNIAPLQILATDNLEEHGVVGHATIDAKEAHVESGPSSATPSHLFPNKINSSPSAFYNVQGELRRTNHTPGARVPSFSQFDALRDDCEGCCLHRYPPTQSLYSRSTAPTALASSQSSPPLQNQVASPQGLGVQTPQVYVSPVPAVHASTRTHTPIPRDDPVPEVHPMTVISTALTATVKASQHLKRTFDTSPSYQQCGSTSTPHAWDPQPDTCNSRAEKASKNIRKLLEMQKTVTELLLDVVDDWPALAEEPSRKRQRQE